VVSIDVRKLSAPIEALRPALGDAYKRLDSKWDEIAETFKSLSIPVEVSYKYCSDEYRPDDSAYLVWKKWNGKKRICLEFHSFNPNNDNPFSDYDVKTTPYEEWSGQQRLDMLKHVPGLFDAAAKATQDFINKTKS
jgi:hypothetical protein